jgi:hypothetical protein
MYYLYNLSDSQNPGERRLSPSSSAFDGEVRETCPEVKC